MSIFRGLEVLLQSDVTVNKMRIFNTKNKTLTDVVMGSRHQGKYYFIIHFSRRPTWSSRPFDVKLTRAFFVSKNVPNSIYLLKIYVVFTA